MRNKKRYIALMLSGVMAFSMAGCMRKGDDTSSDKQESKAASDENKASDTNEASDGQENAEAPVDPEAPYPEEVTLRAALMEKNILFRDGDTYDDNAWYREFKEKYNIKIVNEWVIILQN